MMASFSAQLNERALIYVNGADARAFLQALLTCDMTQVTPTQMTFGALLSPQGKILFDLFISGQEQGFLLDCRKEMRDALLKRMNFYKLRSAVTFTPVDDVNVFALWGEGTEGLADPRLPALGRRQYASISDTTATDDAYIAHRIQHGVPEAMEDYLLGDTFPHEANYDVLSGVDFEKGCYVGQEVVSRMQHKAEIRKRIIPFALKGHAVSGAPIHADTLTIGRLGSVKNNQALGMVRLDKMRETIDAGHKITCGTAHLSPRLPMWANFSIGQPS